MCPSIQAATSLFMAIVRRSNCGQTLVNHWSNSATTQCLVRWAPTAVQIQIKKTQPQTSNLKPATPQTSNLKPANQTNNPTCKAHTPRPTQHSHRRALARKSKSLTSPCSYPAAMHRSCALCACPKHTAQQSRRSASVAGWSAATGPSPQRGSHTRTQPSRPPVTISHAP